QFPLGQESRVESLNAPYLTAALRSRFCSLLRMRWPGSQRDATSSAPFFSAVALLTCCRELRPPWPTVFSSSCSLTPRLGHHCRTLFGLPAVSPFPDRRLYPPISRRPLPGNCMPRSE